ncbi:hypothetical protein WJX82_009396 [Trebouxia sp. C0006]
MRSSGDPDILPDNAPEVTPEAAPQVPAGHTEPFPAANPYVDPGQQYFTKQTSVDHFGSAQFSKNSTFQLRYFLVWPGTSPSASAPIFLFMGSEQDILSSDVGIGYYSELANQIGALQIWPEHRYYANEVPYLPYDNYEHLSVEQALVDHVEVVLHVQKLLGMDQNPVIAIGVSYSGALAAYSRIRFPDVIAGAVASSAILLGCPGLGVDPSFDPYAFAKVATRTASSEAGSAAACPRNVQSFFKELFALSNNSTGVELINQHMKLCSDSKLKSAQDTSGLASFLGELWVIGAQFDYSFAGQGYVANEVQAACNFLADPNLTGTDLLDAMSQAADVLLGNASTAIVGCLATSGFNNPTFSLSSGNVDAWDYQVCTQLVQPFSYDGGTDMFFDLPYDLDGTDAACFQYYGVRSQPNWAATNFGLSAIRQSSYIFFTNGFLDPLSACIPSTNISNTVTVALHDGAHGSDILKSRPASDTPGVIEVRRQAAQLIAQWVTDYNFNRNSIPFSNPANVFNMPYNLGGYTAAVNDTLAGSNLTRNTQVLSSSATQSNAAV